MRKILISIALSMLLLSACNKKREVPGGTFNIPSGAPTGSLKPVASLEVGSKGDELAFDPIELEAKAGILISLKFKNNATKAGLLHNWVLAKPGMGPGVAAAGQAPGNGERTGFIPNTPDMIAHTNLLKPGQHTTILFQVPAPGVYDYVCTVPGHQDRMTGKFKSVP